MLFDPKYEKHVDLLLNEIRRSPAPSHKLFSEIAARACRRIPSLKKSAGADRLNSLIAASAWTDAALVLIELELPHWTLRRLGVDDGEWFCCLSQQPNLPLDLDDTAEASHDVLPLAILGAFLEARLKSSIARNVSVPRTGTGTCQGACCDNFA